MHARIPCDVWTELELEMLDARDLIALHAAVPQLQQLLPRTIPFVARRPLLPSEFQWFAERGITVRSMMRPEYAVDTAKEDFDRYSHFHSWYKHMSLLPGTEAVVFRQKGQQHRYFFLPIDDPDGYHWQIRSLVIGEHEFYYKDRLKVNLNFFLMRTWERYGNDDYHDGRKKYNRPRGDLARVFEDRGGHVFIRHKDQINALIADKYPHLPPFSIDAPESLHAVMRLEFDRMYREFLAAAQQCIDRGEEDRSDYVLLDLIYIFLTGGPDSYRGGMERMKLGPFLFGHVSFV